MPRLPQNIAQTAEQSEVSTGFKPILPGIYRVRCTKVSFGIPLKSDPDALKAEWEYEIVPDQLDSEGRAVRRAKFWHTASYAPEAASLMAMPFRAHGLTFESEDREFIDAECLANIGVKAKYKGAEGEQENKIIALLPGSGAVAAGGAGGTVSKMASADESAAWD